MLRVTTPTKFNYLGYFSSFITAWKGFLRTGPPDQTKNDTDLKFDPRPYLLMFFLKQP